MPAAIGTHTEHNDPNQDRCLMTPPDRPASVFARITAWDFSLGTYLALAFTVLTLLITLTLSQIIGRSALEEVKASTGDRLARLADLTAEQLDRGMFERYRDAQIMVALRELTGPAASTAEKRQLLNRMQKTYPDYAWIGITDAEGKVLVATSGLLEGLSVGSRPWFIDALNGQYVGDVHEAVLLASLRDNPSGDPMRFIDIAFPYQTPAGDLGGVLGIHLSWQWAEEVKRSVVQPIQDEHQVQAMILSKDNLVLLGPPDLLGTQLELESLSRMAAGNQGYALETWPDGQEYLVGYRQSDGHGDYPGLGWRILTRQASAEALMPATELQRKIIVAGAGTALLFSLFGLVAARRITRPLRAVVAAARGFQAGSAEFSVPDKGYREVRRMGAALSGLVAELVAKEAQVRELNRNLEDRVRSRTEQLAEALRGVRAREARIRTDSGDFPGRFHRDESRWVDPGLECPGCGHVRLESE